MSACYGTACPLSVRLVSLCLPSCWSLCPQSCWSLCPPCLPSVSLCLRSCLPLLVIVPSVSSCFPSCWSLCPFVSLLVSLLVSSCFPFCWSLLSSVVSGLVSLSLCPPCLPFASFCVLVSLCLRSCLLSCPVLFPFLVVIVSASSLRFRFVSLLVSLVVGHCIRLLPFLSPFLLAIVSILSPFCFLLTPFLLMFNKWTWCNWIVRVLMQKLRKWTEFRHAPIVSSPSGPWAVLVDFV